MTRYTLEGMTIIVGLIILSIGAFLGYHGIEGWGWLIFFGVIIIAIPFRENKNLKEDEQDLDNE